MIPVDTKQQKTYTLVPAGNHVARIYSIIHIGHILEDTKWGAKNNDKCRIAWELPNETKEFKEGEGEKPLTISAEYNISFGEKAMLRKMLVGLFGAEHIKQGEVFDIESIIGMPCMVNVVHNTKGERTFANVDSVAPLPKGFVPPEPFNKPFLLNYTDRWDEEAFEKLPDFIKDKMKQSDEYKGLKWRESNPEGEDEINPDDIPF